MVTAQITTTAGGVGSLSRQAAIPSDWLRTRSLSRSVGCGHHP
jgi:hypothetical protein